MKLDNSGLFSGGRCDITNILIKNNFRVDGGSVIIRLQNPNDVSITNFSAADGKTITFDHQPLFIWAENSSV